jgi:glycosyltransferase involved in cell wall biosynthesis
LHFSGAFRRKRLSIGRSG